MRSQTTAGVICLDVLRVQHKLSGISYTEFEDGSFFYEFSPCYEVVDLLGADRFQGIPGIDLSLRRDVYRRENAVPVFIEERTPSHRRENVWELLDEQGMDYLNRLEWLIESGSHYSGDHLYVRRVEKNDAQHTVVVEGYEQGGSTGSKAIESVLEPLCQGKTVCVGDIVIDGEARKLAYGLLMPLRRREVERAARARRDGIERARSQGAYRGRSRIPTDSLRVRELHQAVKDGLLTVEQAAAKLGVSVPTFYRRVRELKGVGDGGSSRS